MKWVVKKIGVWQTSKVLVLTEALVAVIVSLFILIPAAIVVASFGAEEGLSFFGMLFVFFLYLLLFMVFRLFVLVIYFFAYNKVAKWVGGAEGSLEPPSEENSSTYSKESTK